MHIPGTVALITGGGQGIGRAIGESLLQRGGKVCIVDLREDVLETTKVEWTGKYDPGCFTVKRSDVSIKEELEASFAYTVDHFGRLDILVNNAGIHNEVQWEMTLHINMHAAIRGSYLAVEYFKSHGEGLIINTVSSTGLKPWRHTLVPHYGASKAGVIAYTRALASTEAVRSKGIRVTGLCPRTTDTALIRNTTEETATDKTKFDSNIAERTKAGYLLSAEFVGEACMDLITDDSKNGVVLHIDGFGAKTFIECPT